VLSFESSMRMVRLSSILSFLVLGLVLFESLPANAVSISEFAVPTAGSVPSGITAGPDCIIKNGENLALSVNSKYNAHNPFSYLWRVPSTKFSI